jgi:hypothetical protein
VPVGDTREGSKLRIETFEALPIKVALLVTIPVFISKVPLESTAGMAPPTEAVSLTSPLISRIVSGI